MTAPNSIYSTNDFSESTRPGKRALNHRQQSTAIDMRQDDHIDSGRDDSTERDNAPMYANLFNKPPLLDTLDTGEREEDESTGQPLVMNCMSLNTFVEGMRSPLYSQSCSSAKRRKSRTNHGKKHTKQQIPQKPSASQHNQRKTKKKLSPELLASLIDADDELSPVESVSAEEEFSDRQRRTTPSHHEQLQVDTSDPPSSQIPLPAESPRFSDFVSGNLSQLRGMSTHNFDFSLLQQTIEAVQESSRAISAPFVIKSNELSDLLARNFDRFRFEDSKEAQNTHTSPPSQVSVDSCPSDEMICRMLNTNEISCSKPLQYAITQQSNNGVKEEPCRSIKELIEESYFQHVIGEALSYIEEETPSGIRGEMSYEEESLLASSASPTDCRISPVHENIQERADLDASFPPTTDRKSPAHGLESPCTISLSVDHASLANETMKERSISCESDEDSIEFSLDDDLESNSTRSSFDFIEDQDLRTTLRLTLEGGNAGLLFPSLSKVSSTSSGNIILGASRSSDDGLGYEIENLEALVSDIQQELATADQFASVQRSPTHTARPAPLRRVGRFVRALSPSEASSIDSSCSDATSISQFSPSSVGRTPAARRRVHFSTENEEYTFLSESRSTESPRNISNFLDDFLGAVDELMEEMSLTCARAVERHRPSNVETVLGTAMVSPRSIARSTMHQYE